jgi:hypothetical protein
MMGEHLLMIEISKAGKRGLLLEDSRPWEASCNVPPQPQASTVNHGRCPENPDHLRPWHKPWPFL